MTQVQTAKSKCPPPFLTPRRWFQKLLPRFLSQFYKISSAFPQKTKALRQLHVIARLFVLKNNAYSLYMLRGYFSFFSFFTFLTLGRLGLLRSQTVCKTQRFCVSD